MQELTLDEYEKILEEKRKALSSSKAEERKVLADKAFESMQLVEKRNDEDVFIKLVRLCAVKTRVLFNVHQFCNINVHQFCNIENTILRGLILRDFCFQGSEKERKKKEREKEKEFLEKEEKARKVLQIVLSPFFTLVS